MGDRGTCSTCGNEYVAIGQHYKSFPSHAPDDWDTCPQCGEKYRELKVHWGASPVCNNPNAEQCPFCNNEYSDLMDHYFENPNHRPPDWDECEQCGERFKEIGQHWSSSRLCESPNLTQVQYEILCGLLMGDGTITETNRNFQCSMITEEYLEYLDEVFGKLSCGVRLHLTAEEKAQVDSNSGFNPNASEENYHNQYVWKLRSIDDVDEFVSWYDSGEKIWPEDLELTPTTLKHWFVGDGSYMKAQGNRYIRISACNEAPYKEKVESYFNEMGIPQPNRWDEYERKDGRIKCDAVWNVRESEELWEYMLSDGRGIPPGFEYKWPTEYRDENTITVDDLDAADAATA